MIVDAVARVAEEKLDGSAVTGCDCMGATVIVFGMVSPTVAAAIRAFDHRRDWTDALLDEAEPEKRERVNTVVMAHSLAETATYGSTERNMIAS
jgi:hypothetical protein